MEGAHPSHHWVVGHWFCAQLLQISTIRPALARGVVSVCVYYQPEQPTARKLAEDQQGGPIACFRWSWTWWGGKRAENELRDGDVEVLTSGDMRPVHGRAFEVVLGVVEAR